MTTLYVLENLIQGQPHTVAGRAAVGVEAVCGGAAAGDTTTALLAAVTVAVGKIALQLAGLLLVLVGLLSFLLELQLLLS